jgi:hypothetical protein
MYTGSDVQMSDVGIFHSVSPPLHAASSIFQLFRNKSLESAHLRR